MIMTVCSLIPSGLDLSLWYSFIYLFFSLGTTVLAAALQKKNARKRRGGPGGGSMSSGGKIKFYLSHF